MASRMSAGPRPIMKIIRIQPLKGRKDSREALASSRKRLGTGRILAIVIIGLVLYKVTKENCIAFPCHFEQA